MSNTNPTFYSNGHTPTVFDTPQETRQKILGAIIDNGTGGGGGGTTGTGIGSGPPGALVEPAGFIYTDRLTGAQYTQYTSPSGSNWQ